MERYAWLEEISTLKFVQALAVPVESAQTPQSRNFTTCSHVAIYAQTVRNHQALFLKKSDMEVSEEEGQKLKEMSFSLHVLCCILHPACHEDISQVIGIAFTSGNHNHECDTAYVL